MFNYTIVCPPAECRTVLPTHSPRPLSRTSGLRDQGLIPMQSLELAPSKCQEVNLTAIRRRTGGRSHGHPSHSGASPFAF